MSIFNRHIQHGFILVASIFFMTACLSGMAPVRADNDVIKGRIIDVNGTGLSNVQVKLVDQENTMMDITSSDKNGYYSIDLSVLDDEELSKLRGFSLIADNKNGKTTRKRLKDKKGKTGVAYQAIVLD